MPYIIKKLIAKLIYNRYASDMGCWFDEIRGHEEETFNEILSFIETHSIKDIMKLYYGEY